MYSFRSGTARGLAEGLDALEISHMNLGKSLTTELAYLQRETDDYPNWKHPHNFASTVLSSSLNAATHLTLPATL